MRGRSPDPGFRGCAAHPGDLLQYLLLEFGLRVCDLKSGEIILGRPNLVCASFSDKAGAARERVRRRSLRSATSSRGAGCGALAGIMRKTIRCDAQGACK